MSYIAFNDLDLKGKRVIVRVDLNLPMDKELISDTTKIHAILQTLKSLKEKGAKQIILLSHLGRPKKGESSPSLLHVASALADLSKESVLFWPNSNPFTIESLPKAPLILLENTRFNEGEESNDLELAKAYAKLGDCYINDAFAVSHRACATVCALPSLFQGRSALGPLALHEIEILTPLLHAPKEKIAFILGGAKVSTKWKLIEKLALRGRVLALGGKLYLPFIEAKKGGTLSEEANEAARLLDRFKNILLPIDGTPEDVGPQTIAYWISLLSGCQFIFWNGPLGIFERPPFDQGTLLLAKELSTLSGATLVAGGGETLAFLSKSPYEGFFKKCTGGGASLEFLENDGQLPGLK